MLERESVFLQTSDADPIIVPRPITLTTDAANGLGVRTGVIEVHGAGSGGMTVDQQVAAGLGSAIGEIVRRQHVTDAIGILGLSIGLQCDEIKSDLDPIPHQRRLPREPLASGQPSVPGPAAFDELKNSLLHPSGRAHRTTDRNRR